MKVLGIEIETKVNILAFAAFIMSISSLLIQLGNIIKGSKVIMDDIELVLIAPESYLKESESRETDKESYMTIITNLNYFNTGSLGYHDVIKSEEAYIYFPSTYRGVRLNAYYYINSSEKENKLYINSKSNAIPFQIKSGNVASHETAFIYWKIFNKKINQNLLKYPNFLKQLEENKEIYIEFIAIDLNNKRQKKSCKLITKTVLKSFNKKNWSSLECMPNNS